MKKSILMLLVLSCTVFAGRAGLVVQLSTSSVITKCVEFQSGESAFDLLENSGLRIATKDYGAELGVALCKIQDVGCETDNCFCQSDYWSFNYVEGGSWVYSSVGVSSYRMRDGDVIGFMWGVWGDEPELHSFNEICAPSNSQSSGVPVRYLDLSMQGSCSTEPVLIEVRERGGDVVWEPTNFISFDDGLRIDVENGVEVKVLFHQTYSGRDAGFEKVAMLFTDAEGKGSFIPERAGRYRLEFEKGGFLGENRELEVAECEKEVEATSRIVEKSEFREGGTERNVTRVEIIAPESAAVNSTVLVRMVSEDGKPLAYESITVEFSGGRKGLLTNESGEATFEAEHEGVYSYSSPKYLLSSFKVTNIIEPSRIVLKPQTAAAAPREGATPSVGMALVNPLPTVLPVLAVGVIILAFLSLLRGVRK